MLFVAADRSLFVRSLRIIPRSLAFQKSAWWTRTRSDPRTGDLHSGHSGFWLAQAEMQAQQKTWPQGVAVGQSR